MAKKRSVGTPGALFMAMSELVLHGLPTTSTRTSLAAFLAMAWPWPVKIFPLMPSKSLRSMPALRGTAPTSSAQFTPLKPSSRFEVGTMPLSSGNAQSSSSMHTPLQRGHGFFVGNFDEVQDDRLVRPEHRAGGDAEQKGITDLAGGAGDSNANGGLCS